MKWQKVSLLWKKGLSIPRGLEPQSIGFCIPMLNHFATQKSMVGWAIISSWLLLSQCNCLSKWKKRDGKVWISSWNEDICYLSCYCYPDLSSSLCSPFLSQLSTNPANLLSLGNAATKCHGLPLSSVWCSARHQKLEPLCRCQCLFHNANNNQYWSVILISTCDFWFLWYLIVGRTC